ncbi:flagellin B [Neokomagataea thailandica NBRC 106555]|uniref:Flagellin n=2 Tax=Neokomagataea TaxID=1223423 RepID=A0A4Y6V329_9PROT|nr:MULTISPECIES: flagellin [Neokomagataea]QDH24439.1 flagellin B [Neokomagataea tanensis]GBR50810.1 flagellin B [Neokomagataea thailandica NBRC 106555]
MSMSINTNTAAMAALQSLNQTSNELDKTQNAVSTGKKVNSAADNPAVYAISQGMNAQISGLSGVSTGLQFAGQVLNTATQATSSITSNLTTLSSTITQAANNGMDQSKLNSAIQSTLQSIDSAATTATFQGVNLLSGSKGNGVTYNSISAAQDVSGNLFTQSGFNATSAGLGLEGLSSSMSGVSVGNIGTLSGTGTSATVLQVQNQSAANKAGVAGNPAVTTSFVLDSKPGDSSGAGAAVTGLISDSLTANSGYSVSISSKGLSINDASGKSAISSATVGSDGTTTYKLKNGDSIQSQADASGNMTYSVAKGSDVDANGNITAMNKIVDVDISKTDTSISTTQQNNANQSKLVTAINNAGFGAQTDNDGSITLAGGNLDTTTTNVKVGTYASGQNGAAGSVTASSTATATQTSGTAVVQLAVGAALNSIERISAKMGVATNSVTQLQSSTSSLSDSLTSGVGALTDADMAAESAKLTSLQTKQQLAIQSLSIANSQSSQIMSLFRG